MTIHADRASPEDAPCDACHLSDVCRTQKLLCAAYSAYCDHKPWMYVERQPTHERFEAFYREPSAQEHENLERYLENRRQKRLLREAKNEPSGRT